MADFMKQCAEIIESSPEIMNNPRTKDAAQEALNIFKTGDVKAGERMANRILSNVGTTR